MNGFVNSIKRNGKGIILISISAFMVSIGQYLWKIGIVNINTIEGIIYILVGFAIYGLSSIIMLAAFKQSNLSVIHPFLSLSSVFSLFIGYTILNENISLIKIGSVILIIGGVVLISGGD